VFYGLQCGNHVCSTVYIAVTKDSIASQAIISLAVTLCVLQSTVW